MPTSLDAIFFDLGGTLFSYRTFRPHSAALILEAAERLGVEQEPRDVFRTYNAAGGRATARITCQPFYLHRDLFLETYREFVRALCAREADDAFLDWFYTTQRQMMVEHMELRDDCLSTLEALRERGLHLAIVSNIDDDYLEPMVAKSGLAERVDAWTSSESAGSCKPDTRFFEVALEKARVSPERTLFVGDSPVHDVAGARAIGMRSVLIEEPGSPPPVQDGGTPAEPDHRIRALGELLDLVARC